MYFSLYCCFNANRCGSKNHDEQIESIDFDEEIDLVGITTITVPALYSKEYRNRPVDEVIEEIKSLEGKQIFFTANNIAENPYYLKELVDGWLQTAKEFYSVKLIFKRIWRWRDGHVPKI